MAKKEINLLSKGLFKESLTPELQRIVSRLRARPKGFAIVLWKPSRVPTGCSLDVLMIAAIDDLFHPTCQWFAKSAFPG